MTFATRIICKQNVRLFVTVLVVTHGQGVYKRNPQYYVAMHPVK